MYKTIDDFDFRGKVVLLRSGLNSPIEKGKIVMNDRLIESNKTIKELRKKGARVVIMSHQGRPGNKNFRSLEEHAKLLKVKFVRGFNTDKAMKATLDLKNGEALLLENVRNLKEEFNPSLNNKMVKKFKGVFDIYINDAFSVSHRNHTSIVSFPRVMPSGIGRLMEKELNHLEKLDLAKTLFILGGAKPVDNILLMKAVLKKKGRVLTCGIFGQLCVIAGGVDLGQKKYLGKKMDFVKELKKFFADIETPIDFAVKVKGKRAELPLRDFPSKYEIFDIGKATQASYVDEIGKAKCVFMKGPAGYCEEKQFCEGTRALYTAISKVAGFTVIGGGHASAALAEMGINKKKFGYISLSGGASAKYLAGEKLVGLEALK